MGGHRFGAEQPSGETADCPRQRRGGRGPAENKKCLPNTPTGGPISPDSVLHTLHRVLERAGISGYIMRAPKLISGEGCSHCVKVAERWLAPALKVLNREGLGPKRVFLQNEEGSYSEVTV